MATPVDLAAEAIRRHEAGAAAARTAVDQAVRGLDRAEIVEQVVGLCGLEPVQFPHDTVLSGRLRSFDDRPVGGADAVVVVVETVDLAELPRCDPNRWNMRPVTGDT